MSLGFLSHSDALSWQAYVHLFGSSARSLALVPHLFWPMGNTSRRPEERERGDECPYILGSFHHGAELGAAESDQCCDSG